MSSVPTTKVRMDRSKYYSTVHGERSPGDPAAGVVFKQDGLPYDADGVLMMDTVAKLCTDEQKQRVVRLVEKAAKAAEARKPKSDDGGGDGADDGGSAGEIEKDPANVNIEAWLRGEQKVEWFALAAAIRARYGKNVNNKRNALIFLVEEEKVLPLSQVGPEHKKVLEGA